MKYKCRAMGYDTAEMKPKKDAPHRDEEKALALKAKERFIELMGGLNSIVKLKCLKKQYEVQHDSSYLCVFGSNDNGFKLESDCNIN